MDLTRLVSSSLSSSPSGDGHSDKVSTFIEMDRSRHLYSIFFNTYYIKSTIEEESNYVTLVYIAVVGAAFFFGRSKISLLPFPPRLPMPSPVRW